MRCIDIHSHHRQSDNCFRIISLDTRTFSPEVRYDHPYSLGLHPWFIEQQDCEEALRKIAAALDDRNMLAVGECGLDKLTTAPMSLQESLFKAQLHLAEQAGKPLLIHCVRAFNELIRIKKTG
ncbi:MAG: TatD family hydrolase, partial [Gammaproteobacteria bacterium]